MRTARTLALVNQDDGFDCMGCAWPDPAKRHHAEFCENGAKAVAEEATRFRADRAFFAQWSVADIAAQSDFWIGKRGRLTEPMYLAPGATHYAPITWDGAYGLIARRARRARLTRRGDLLHVGPDQQRGRVRLPGVRAGVRDQQPAGLLEHVPRVLGRGAHPDGRDRQGQRDARGRRARRPADRRRAEPGHEPSADAQRAGERRSARGAKIVSINPLREAGLSRFDNPQKLAGHRRARRPSSPTCTCRSASTATWRCSRRSTAAAGARRGRPRVRRAPLRRLRRTARRTCSAASRSTCRRRPA